jgi:hypothetical protein
MLHQNLCWWKVLAELVDNSFDAGASRVVISPNTDRKSRAVVVEDDGRGAADVLSLVTLGRHVEHNTTSLGIHGVGAKDAWLWCGGVIDINSVHAGKRSSLHVDYRDVQSRGWKCDDPTITPTTDQSGMRISLTLSERRNLPPSDTYGKIAFIFTPALSRGLQIISRKNGKSTALEPVRLPLLQDAVNAEFDIDGKTVAINIGILPDGVKMQNGPFWLQYGHRIVGETSLGASLGTTCYSTSRIGGVIVLGKGWKLTRNKDDLSDNRDRLNDAIFCRIEHLLQKGQSLAESIESQLLRSELESALNESVRPSTARKEKRSKGETHGTVLPIQSGQKRRKASQTQEGSGSVDESGNRTSRRGFAFDWCSDDELKIGRFDSIGTRVYLNECHPFISQARAANNRPSMLACAYLLIAQHAATTRDQNKLLAFEAGDVLENFGRFASTIKVEGATNEKTAAS